MEFVLVTFPRERQVLMDGAPQGLTNQVIGVQAGHHDFDLGDPLDYAPSSIPAVVVGTTAPQPLVISFQPAAVLVGAGAPPSARRSTPRRARRVRKAGKKKASKKRTARKATTRKKKTTKKTAPKRKKKNTKKTRRRR